MLPLEEIQQAHMQSIDADNHDTYGISFLYQCVKRCAVSRDMLTTIDVNLGQATLRTLVPVRCSMVSR
jgi:hypothetical protein